jgi:hypothetical protein
MSEKQVRAAKKYVLDYMNKAVHKRREHDKKKKAREEEKAAAEKKTNGTAPPIIASGLPDVEKDEEEDMDIEMSDDEAENTTSDLASIKRKRDGETPATPLDEDDTTAGANKRLKTEEEATPPPPPPPPPPPAEDDYPMDESATPTQEPSPVESEERGYEEVKTMIGNGTRSPVQLATPSTNGSYEHELKVKGQAKGVLVGGV